MVSHLPLHRYGRLVSLGAHDTPIPLLLSAARVHAPGSSRQRRHGRAGSDFMVDTIKALGFEYICANPGSSFRGLHESVILSAQAQPAPPPSQGFGVAG